MNYFLITISLNKNALIVNKRLRYYYETRVYKPVPNFYEYFQIFDT